MSKFKFFISKKSYKYIILFVFIIFILIPLSLPSINYKLGNIFFGKIPKLYNVYLAQEFFRHSAYPIIGNSAPYAHHQLSRIYFIKGGLSLALEEAKKEIETYPDHLATYYIIGLTYGYMNREEDAIDAFSKYIDAYPESWAGRNDKAWLEFRLGDIDGALETIKPVANIIGNPWIQNTYGTLLMNKKRYKEAKEAFTYSQNTVRVMTEESWGSAYPGNDPRIYSTGLQAMKS